jgi:hypothetical protein
VACRKTRVGGSCMSLDGAAAHSPCVFLIGLDLAIMCFLAECISVKKEVVD